MEKRRFTIGESLNGLLAAFFFSYVVQLLLVVTAFSTKEDTFLWLGYFINAASFFFAVLIFSRTKKVDFFSGTRFVFKFNLRSAPILFLISVCVILTSLIFATAFGWLLELIGCNVSVKLPQIESWQQILLAVVIIGIFAPAAEEIMFRGAVLGSLEKRGPMKAVLLSALIFSLMHCNPVQTIHQFILGVILALLVLASGSVIPAIAVHIINNLLVIILPLIFPALGGSFEFSLNLLIIFMGLSVLGAIGVILLLPLFFLLHAEGEKLSAASYKTALLNIFKKGGLKQYINSTANADTKEEKAAAETVKRENLKIFAVLTVFGVLWLISFIGGFYV